METVLCPYCNTDLPLSSVEGHINSHENEFANDEDLAKYLSAQEEQALSETAAMKLVEKDLQKRENFDAKSPLSSVITTPEQLAQAIRNSEQKDKEREGEIEKGKGPTAIDFNANFLSFVDTSRRERDEKETEEISQVILFDIDNCGGEFEQIADAFVQMPKIIVYVVGGPGLPNVSNVKLPTFAEMHQTKRLHVIPMTKKGKNAADFVLSFYGGVLHEKLPLKIPFVVVSRDKGLQQLVEHLGLLGRAAKLISNDIVKHLSVQPLILHPTNTTTTTTTTSSTTDVDNNNNNNEMSYLERRLEEFNGNPFKAFANEFSLEQPVWFAVSELSKIKVDQRPKTRSRLENVVSSYLKRIPGGVQPALTADIVVQAMLYQTFIAIDGSKGSLKQELG